MGSMKTTDKTEKEEASHIDLFSFDGKHTSQKKNAINMFGGW